MPEGKKEQVIQKLEVRQLTENMEIVKVENTGNDSTVLRTAIAHQVDEVFAV